MRGGRRGTFDRLAIFVGNFEDRAEEGARRSGILRQFAGHGLRVAAAGCAGGLGLALLLTRALSGMLYGISATDPATLSAVVILVLAVATLSALIPATRAALMQPMRTLREE